MILFYLRITGLVQVEQKLWITLIRFFYAIKVLAFENKILCVVILGIVVKMTFNSVADGRLVIYINISEIQIYLVVEIQQIALKTQKLF